MANVVGQEAIAEVFGVAPKTIVEWQEQGFPIAVRGGPGVPSEYDSAACISWLVDREVKKVRGESPRDRLFRLQAESIEMDMAERRGQLVHVDSVEPRLRAAVLAAREFLLRQAPDLAGRLEGCDKPQRLALLRTTFENFLRRLAAWRTAEDDPEAEGT